MTKPHKITVLYAWVAEHPNGEDGIPAINGGDGVVLPLVGSDRERMESLRSAALSCAMQGMPVKLCKFSAMEVLERIEVPKCERWAE